MCCLQVVDYGSLILAFFSTPRAKSYTGEVSKGIQVMNAFQAHDLRWFQLPAYILLKIS